MSTKVQIKGIREGLLVTLGEGSWDELHPVLLEHLDQQAGFLQGARLALDVGSLVLKAVDLGQLTKEISDRGLTLWAVLGESPTTERSTQSFGLATRITKPVKERPCCFQRSSQHKARRPPVLVRRTLRSGSQLAASRARGRDR